MTLTPLIRSYHPILIIEINFLTHNILGSYSNQNSQGGGSVNHWIPLPLPGWEKQNIAFLLGHGLQYSGQRVSVTTVLPGER